MQYEECLNFLFEQLPLFQRQGQVAFNRDLAKTIALCNLIDNPQNDLKFIHVAGTNGKGSVCHTLASVWMEAGYKTGLYTSPHLFDFRERIRVNGAYVEKTFVVDFVKQVQHHIVELQPSFFELTFAMSLAYFKHTGCDIVVLETGMGGRLDSTNVVQPVLSIITTIGLDHQQYLGDTIALIAAEKGGIIKPDIPLLIGNLPEDANNVIRQIANKQGAPLFKSDSLFNELKETQGTRLGSDHFVPVAQVLPGQHQLENLAIVCGAFQILQSAWSLPTEALTRGTQNMQNNFPILGRWQILHQAPKVVCDVGHNSDGIQAIVDKLENETFERLHIVFGMVNDKNPDILKLLPKDAQYYLCKAQIPRALPTSELQELFTTNDLQHLSTHNDAVKAAQKAFDHASQADLILVMGSLFVVGEVLEAFEKGALTFAR